MIRNGNERAHLRLAEFSDRELLHALEDVCGRFDGWASAKQLAAAIGLQGLDPHKACAQRLSWQYRFGSVEREHLRDESGNLQYRPDGKARYSQNWRLTEIGRSMVHGRLTKGAQSALGRLADGDMLELTRWLGQRTLTNGASPTASKLVEREWQYALAQRKL